jgi:hypothetical protein
MVAVYAAPPTLVMLMVKLPDGVPALTSILKKCLFAGVAASVQHLTSSDKLDVGVGWRISLAISRPIE